MNSDIPGLLNGKVVLLVEDQSLIALDTEAMLVELGADKVATFTNAADALAWLGSDTPSIAVLDVNLGTTSSFPVAEELVRRGVSFVFTTGYGDSLVLPATFTGTGIVSKPYTIDALSKTLSARLSDRSNV